MSGADLLEDGFPHSTPEGYKAGCQGRSCPGVVDNGISCADSFARYQGDYGFRKKVDAGMSPQEIVAAESAGSEQLDAKPKPRPVAKPTAEPLPAGVQAEVESAIADADGEPTKDIPLEKHGTPKGYYLGCRLKEACPGIERVGKSCNQAINEYQKTIKENRKKRAAAEAGTAPDEPASVTIERAVERPETPPDSSLTPTADHRLVSVDVDGEVCSCGHRDRRLIEHLASLVIEAMPSDLQPEAATAVATSTAEVEPVSPTAAADDELQDLRSRVAELEQLLQEASAVPAAVTTLADGTRVTVVVTVERAA